MDSGSVILLLSLALPVNKTQQFGRICCVILTARESDVNAADSGAQCDERPFGNGRVRLEEEWIVLNLA